MVLEYTSGMLLADIAADNDFRNEKEYTFYSLSRKDGTETVITMYDYSKELAIQHFKEQYGEEFKAVCMHEVVQYF